MGNYRVQTGLNIEDSKTVINAALAKYSKDYPQYNPSFRFTGQNTGVFSAWYNKTTEIKGEIVLSDGSLEIKMGKLPFMLSMLESSLVAPIQKTILEWVELFKKEKAKAGR